MRTSKIDSYMRDAGQAGFQWKLRTVLSGSSIGTRRGKSGRAIQARCCKSFGREEGIAEAQERDRL